MFKIRKVEKLSVGSTAKSVSVNGRAFLIANNCGGSLDMLRQEYPSNPDEAFLHSGTGVFDNEQVIIRRETAPEPIKRGRFVWADTSSAPVGHLPPQLLARVKMRIGQGKTKWGAEPGREYYVLPILTCRRIR